MEPREKFPSIGLDKETLKKRKPRHLPHWSCMRAVYHVVFRLFDSVPKHVQEQWLAERIAILRMAEKQKRPLTVHEEQRLEYLFSDRIERYLDRGYGQCWLKIPCIAKMVKDALLHFDGKRYRLYAWCIMPNHVHVIIEPFDGFQVTQIAGSWKSLTAIKANKHLHRTGQFWMHESFDHIIRSEKALAFQIDYVWNNPVKIPWINCLRWKIDE